MRTARSIEEQEARKVDAKEVNLPRFHSQNSAPVGVEARESARRRQLAGLKPWPKGVSGNPGGRPKTDLAAEIARAVFEQDGQAIFDAFRKLLRKGSPYGFQVLADCAFGEMKETIAHEHTPYSDASDEDIEKRIAELKAKLGWPAEPKAQEPAGEPKLQ
jgi:hypothetical protein